MQFVWFKTYCEDQKTRKVGAPRFERMTKIVAFRGLFFFAFPHPKWFYFGSDHRVWWTSTSTGDIQATMVRHQWATQALSKAKTYQKRSVLLYNGQRLVWITIIFCSRVRPSQRSRIVRKSMLHDKARPHVSQIIVRKLKELSFAVLPYPPYSPVPRQSTTIFPSTFRIFRATLSPPIRRRQKRPSSTYRISRTQFLCWRN